MRKIGVLLTLIFLLTGCSATYNITIENNTISDELIIENAKSETYSDGMTYEKLINVYYNQNVASDINTPGYPEVNKKIEGYTYYDKSIIDKNWKYCFKLNNSFAFYDYKNSPLLLEYSFKSIEVNNNKIVINSNTNKGCTLFDNYPYLDNMVINIITNHKVVSNNADEIKENTYTWFINKNNYKTKEIAIQIDKSVVSNNTLLDEKESNILTIFLIGTLLVAIFIFSFYTYYKVKFSNN